jgi:glutamyl-tRNA reductase
LPDRSALAAFAPLQVAVVRAAALGERSARVLALDSDAVLSVPSVPPRPASCFALVTCERLTLVLWGALADAGHVLHTILGHHGILLHHASIERWHGEPAVRHLLSLAAGLESSRLGETEILGQLRAAWCTAQERGVTDASLDAILQRVIAGARHVRAALPESALTRTLGEEAMAAVTTRRAAPWSAARVLVVGTGEAAISALGAIMPLAPAVCAIIGRTPARVGHVARRFGAAALEWSTLRRAVTESDVVVFAVRSPTTVVDVARDVPRSGAVWIDLGAPSLVANAQLMSPTHYVSLTMLHATLRTEPARVAAGAEAVDAELQRYRRDLHRRSTWSAIATA